MNYENLDESVKKNMEGLMVSRFAVEVTADNATPQNYLGGQSNGLVESIEKGCLQTGATEFTISLNPTHGGLADTLESFVDKTFEGGLLTTGIAKQTGQFVVDVLASNDG
jgi:hypothetical protein